MITKILCYNILATLTLSCGLALAAKRAPSSSVKCTFSVGEARNMTASGTSAIEAQANAAQKCTRKNIAALEARYRQQGREDLLANPNDPQVQDIFDQCINLRCASQRSVNSERL